MAAPIYRDGPVAWPFPPAPSLIAPPPPKEPAMTLEQVLTRVEEAIRENTDAVRSNTATVLDPPRPVAASVIDAQSTKVSRRKLAKVIYDEIFRGDEHAISFDAAGELDSVMYRRCNDAAAIVFSSPWTRERKYDYLLARQRNAPWRPNAQAIATVRALVHQGYDRDTVNAIEAVCTWAERSP